MSPKPKQLSILKRIDSAKLGIVVDLFAGGGGASTGLEAALGRPVDLALNHDRVALEAHMRNHPHTEHLEADIWDVEPRKAVRGRKVDILWASPDCTHFSVAKGGKPRQQGIRSLAWAVVRWAAVVKPRVIFLENVGEFRTWGPLTDEGKLVKARMGETFKRWVRKIENLGYAVDYRVLDASRYGAPTRRRRLFLVARRDGVAISWPEPTHGPTKETPSLLPLHTAAECIDWSRPCPSIFERDRPLAEKTLWRIAQGLRRFVLENPRPFIVSMAHGQVDTNGKQRWGVGAHSAEAPLGTVTASNPFGVVIPTVVGVGGRAGQSSATSGAEPVGTITAKNDRAVVTAAMMNIDNRSVKDSSSSPTDPLSTIVGKARHTVIAPSLVKVNHGKLEPRGASIEEPLGTVTASRRGDALVAPTLIQTSYGERPGQRPRYLDLHQPVGTIVAGGQKHALVSAFLAKHFGDRGQRPGSGMDEPTSTITATDHHSLAAVALAKFRGTDPSQPASGSVEEPLPTISAGGIHVAEVRAFLTTYYGSDGTGGQELEEPMRTMRAKACLGLVTVEGAEYLIADIGMRMLEPEELLRAQFGRFAASYDLTAAKTKAKKVRLIGNSVCPEVAEAVVLANMTPEELARRSA